MENPAKALILAACIGIWSCKSTEDASKNLPKSFGQSSTPDSFPAAVLSIVSHNKIPIGKGLYKDSLGTIYLKTKNRKVRNPDRDDSNRPDSIFHPRISLRDADEFRELSEIVDVASFSPIDERGVYFEDTAYIYVYAIWPYPDPFFALKKRGARFLDTEKEYLLADGVLYWDGKIVDSIAAEKAKVVRFKKVGEEGFHEFITDGKFLIYGYYPLDEKLLADFKGLAESDKDIIRKRYFRKDSGRRLDGAR